MWWSLHEMRVYGGNEAAAREKKSRDGREKAPKRVKKKASR